MRLVHDIVTAGIDVALHMIFRIDAAQISRIPDHGPLIVVANHVNSLEVPIVYTHFRPRPMTGFAKAEVWQHPFLGPLAKLWGAIPLHRGEADVEAFRAGLAALDEGKILCVAPEGTRSYDGRLQRGLPGMVVLALRTGVPLMPMAYYGGEYYQRNLRRLRRTDFHVVVGDPFVLEPGDRRVDRGVRQAMADEVMARIAALLPPAYRGVYADSPPFTYTRTTTLET